MVSALAWLQAAMLVGYSRLGVIKAVHRALHKASAGSQHFVQAIIKALVSLPYSL